MSNAVDEINKLVKSGCLFTSNPYTTILPRNPNPLALSKWYKNELAYLDEKLNKLERENNLPNTCTAGCSHCCSHVIALNPHEAMILSYKIKSLPVNIQKEVKEKSAHICNFLISKNLAESNFFSTGVNLSEGYKYSRLKETIKEEYFSYKLECPLLFNNKCLLYDYRPLTCMSYRCYDDPRICSQNAFAETVSFEFNDYMDIQFRRMRNLDINSRILPYLLNQTLL